MVFIFIELFILMILLSHEQTVTRWRHHGDERNELLEVDLSISVLIQIRK